jgi:tetratricopeptide (TPR) repeat protein
MRRVLRLGWAAAACWLGCGPATPTPVVPAPMVDMAEVEADPLLLLAQRTDMGVQVEEIDAGELLERAAELVGDGAYLEAVALYDEVASRFAGTTAEGEAWYRKGVALEWAEDWAGARVAFERRLALAGDGPLEAEALPALIHASLLAEQLELWDEAVEGFERLLAAPELSAGDRRAAQVRLAVVQAGRGEVDAARSALEAVIVEADRAIDAGETVHTAPPAEAEYRLGLLALAELDDLRLDTLDGGVLRRQVERIGDVFGGAFVRLANALRSGNAFWAVQAGWRIGETYMRVYELFVDAPVPDTLRGEQRRAYLALLRARTRILLANALEAWEENLLRAERTGVRGSAVDRTAEGIARVEEILEQRAAHRSEMDDMVEDFLAAQGEADPLGPLLQRLGLEVGDGAVQGEPVDLTGDGTSGSEPPATSGEVPAEPPEEAPPAVPGAEVPPEPGSGGEAGGSGGPAGVEEGPEVPVDAPPAG